jgi:diketogulonate reductase-like aldo/keto reductase
MPSIPRVAAGASIPVIGLGTWLLSGDECARAVATALRCGYRHIDTAAMYGNEAAVGEGLRASGVARDQVSITTKVWLDAIADGPLQRSAEASLKVERADIGAHPPHQLGARRLAQRSPDWIQFIFLLSASA